MGSLSPGTADVTTESAPITAIAMNRVLSQKFHRLFAVKSTRDFVQTSILFYSKRLKPDVSDIPELNEPPLKKYYEAYFQPLAGRVHDKKPFKLKCTEGKIYYWCVCGWSHDQPLCDGRCILPEMKIKLRPVVFKPKETREYWLCNCKQTKNRPFCDGSHNSELVQTSNSVIKRGKFVKVKKDP